MMSTRKFANAKKDSDWDRREIIERVRQLRVARFGPRGQTKFCKTLGISPSTYHYYEHDRVPPPDLMVRMAQAGRTNLTWLLTGQGSMDAPEMQVTGPAGQVLERVSRLLQDRSRAADALTAFVELLEKIEAVQRQRPDASGQDSPAGKGGSRILQMPPATSISTVIPVLGRAAAAVPQFWADKQEGTGLTNQLAAAVASLGEGQRLEARSQIFGSAGRPHNVALVQFAEPLALAGLSIAEVLESAGLATRWPEAFALRIDGDSMQPLLQDNDLVVVSPKLAAKDGQPAIVQMAGQIGVTCKVYRRAKGQVRLIPANSAYPTTVHPKAEVTWAFRVLARIRVQ